MELVGNLRIFWLLFFILLCAETSEAQQLFSKNLTGDQWHEDLDSLVSFIEKTHPDPYFRFSEAGFDEYLTGIKDKLGSQKSDQNVISLMKLVASLEDGHSHIPFHQHALNISALPVKMFKFDDGLYITDAIDSRLERLKVLKIGVKTAEELYYDFLSIIPADNIHHVKNIYVFWGIFPEILSSIGAIENTESVEFQVQDEKGAVRKIDLSPVSFSDWRQWWSSLDNRKGLPLYRSNWDQYYWHNKLNEGKTLYMKFNQVLSRQDTNLTQYSKYLGDMIEDDDRIERMVIDLRENPGGNKFRMRPLVKMLKASEKLNRPGKLFLITGRRTNSAATSFITEMKFNTHAMTIGEPIGGSPNFYSDVRDVILPNSGLKISISTQLQQDSFYGDERRSHFPDISIPISSKDYFRNRDTVMDFLKSYDYSTEEGWSDESSDTELQKVGKYKLGPATVLTVGNADKYLKIFSPDLVEKALKFNEHIDRFETSDGALRVKLSQDQDSLHIFGYGIDMVLNKLPDGYLTPIEKIENGKIGEGIEEIRKLLSEYESEAIIEEGRLNSIGYRLLRDGQFKNSIKIFKLNTELYPKSANVYDSLGEAYMEAGEREKAIINYSKSLEINPDNEGAKEKLKKLKGQN